MFWGCLFHLHERTRDALIIVGVSFEKEWGTLSFCTPTLSAEIVVERCKLCSVQSRLFDLSRLLKYNALKLERVNPHIVIHLFTSAPHVSSGPDLEICNRC